MTTADQITPTGQDPPVGQDPPMDTAVAGGRSTAVALLARPTFWVGAVVVCFWVVTAAAWPVLVPYDVYAVDPAAQLAAPGAAHWLGTDHLGRDVLSRILAGSTSVLVTAAAATILGVALGTAVGLLAGYYRGWVDAVVMRFVDAAMSLPVIIPAILVLTVVHDASAVVVVIALFFAPLVARTVRAAARAERDREYVDAAVLRGDRGPRIALTEILPTIARPVLVEATIRLGYAIFAAASLSFLQLGPQPPSPDWGLTIGTERLYLQTAPWTVAFPALAIASLVIAVNLVADALVEVWQR